MAVFVMIAGLVVENLVITAGAVVTTSSTLRPNADGTTTGWAQLGCTSTTFWDCVDDDPDTPDDATSYVEAPNITSSSMFLQLGETPADFAGADQVEIKARSSVNRGTTNSNDTITLNFQIFAADQTTAITGETSATTPPTSPTYATSAAAAPITGANTKTAWDGARIRLRQTYAKGSTKNPVAQARITAVEVTLTVETLSGNRKIVQRGYVWENDDEDEVAGDAVDDNTQQAAGNTALTGVRKGERLDLRVQLDNVGDAPATEDLGLFFDRNDGRWSRVGTGSRHAAALASCTAADWQCATIDATGDMGSDTHTIIDTSGVPWTAYWDKTNFDLRVARYVGSGGTGCTSAAWTCWIVDSAGDVGDEASIATDRTGAIWIAYWDRANNDLRAAQYVGTGGTGCADAAWSCTTVDAVGGVGDYTAMVLRDGVPWVSYFDATNIDLKVARKVPGGGCADSGWTCESIDASGDVGYHTKIAVAQSGQIWVIHYNFSDGSLRVVTNVDGTGCTTSTWTCVGVDVADDVGRYGGIAIAPDGTPWIGYANATNGRGRLARLVGSGGTGCAVSQWTCEDLDTGGRFYSIAFDTSGTAWLSYLFQSTGDLKVARYVGAGGTGCVHAGFTCVAVDTPNTVGQRTGLAFDPDGTAWVSYYDTTNLDLRMARLSSRSDIRFAASPAGATGDPVQESHADMTSATDTVNRDDADCISGGTWNAGRFSENSKLGGVTLPRGDATAQCTEVAFAVDTSNAVSGTTYRFVVASLEDTSISDRQPWRAPTSVVHYPTLTIEASSATRLSKAVSPSLGTCDGAGWGCVSVDSTGDVGTGTSTAFDASGAPWTSYRDGTNADVRVARYVGAGGTGCATAAWTCVTVDATGDLGSTGTSLGFDTDGVAWLAYFDATNGDLRVARYVGSGGSGCAVAAWSCTSVATAEVTGHNPRLAFTSSGPWVSYRNATSGDLWVAQHVGSGGFGCASAAWRCILVDSTNDTGHDASISVDATGSPWVSYRDAGLGDLKIARYVGGGGTGCTSTGWTCTAVDTTDDSGLDSSLAFDAGGTAWISYSRSPGLDIVVARFVGSGGTGCTSTAWTCTTLESAASLRSTSLAFDATGAAWVSYRDGTAADLRIARHVGSAGSGCDSAEWTCTAVSTGGDVGADPSVAFDLTGAPWVSYRDATNADLRMARMSAAPVKPVSSAGIGFPGRSARRSDGIALDHGDTARPFDTACGATAPRAGYCGTATDDTAYDAATSQAGERPAFLGTRVSGTNTDAIKVEWTGRSTAAPSTHAVTVELWRGGTVKNWETLAPTTDTCSTAAANTDCQVAGGVSANLADYYDSVAGEYRIYTRVAQAAGAQTLSTDVMTVTLVSNAAPDAPASLTQKDSAGTAIATGGSTADTTIAFGASITDPNNPDTLSLCVEVDPIGTAFSGTEDACGTGVAYSGTAVTASVSRTLTAGTDYHWQVRVKDSVGAYSAWTTYGGNLESAADFTITASTNTAPSAPASLDQRTAGGVSLAVGAWHNNGSITFTGSVSDPDASDTLALCVEVDALGTAFSGTEDACGAGVAYSGTAVTASIARTLTDGQYHWQARVRDAAGVYSPWVSFGAGNAETARDLGIDTTAPGAGTVYDGTTAGIDAAYNDGSLTTLSGNWDGYTDTGSGIASYDYAVGTTAGGTDILNWTGNGSATAASPSGLTLSTSVTYFFSVRAFDAAGNTTTATANGQQVAVTLTVSIAGLAAGSTCGDVTTNVATTAGTVPLGHLSSVNQHSIGGHNITVHTNAANGYTVHVSTTGPATGTNGHNLTNAPGTNTTPAAWPTAGTEAVGYTTSSRTLSGIATRFAGALWAAFTSTASEVARSTGPATTGNTDCIATGASRAGNTPPDSYTTIIRYTTVAAY